MKLVFLITDLSRRSGGPPNEISFLSRELLAAGVQVGVLTNPRSDSIILPTGVTVSWLEGGWGQRIALIRRVLAEADFVFIWGVWSPLEGPLFRFLRPGNCRYAVKTLGMLEPYIMGRNRLKKAAARLVYLNRNLRRANAVLVDTMPEKKRVESLRLSKRIQVCHNGVDVPELLRVPRTRTILYLGRIAPKKGLDLLLEAMPGLLLKHPEVKLVVAGTCDDPRFQRRIDALMLTHQLQASVLFSGQVEGVQKQRLLQEAACFVLPSHSEGFSNAVLEALAAGTPVFITPGCNFPEVEPDGLGAVLPREPAIWSARLVEFFSGRLEGIKSSEEIRAHIRRHFSWRKSAEILLLLARTSADTP